MKILDRVTSDTPKFWKRLRLIGVVLGAVSATVLSGGTALPLAIVTVAGYVGTASAVLIAVSSAAVKVEPDATPSDITDHKIDNLNRN